MKTIKNETSGLTINLTVFENWGELSEFLADKPEPAEKALGCLTDYWRYHSVNDRVRAKKEKLASDKPEVRASASKIVVPLNLAHWLIETVKVDRSSPSQEDQKKAAAWWARISEKLEKALSEPSPDLDPHQVEFNVLNAAAAAFNAVLHPEAQLPTMAEAFDEDGEPNEHPLDERRIALAIKLDRQATARAKEEVEF